MSLLSPPDIWCGKLWKLPKCWMNREYLLKSLTFTPLNLWMIKPFWLLLKKQAASSLLKNTIIWADLAKVFQGFWLKIFQHHRNLSPLRSEEHTSELQSRENLVCRLLLEKKNHSSTTS